MNKKYIVRVTRKERRTLDETIQKLNGSSQKVRRAQMLLKVDVVRVGLPIRSLVASCQGGSPDAPPLRALVAGLGLGCGRPAWRTCTARREWRATTLPISERHSMTTSVRRYQYELFADYFQFYLQDESVKGDLSDSWTPEAVDRLLALAPGTVGVGTVRNMTVPVTVEVLNEPPPDDSDSWDHLVECTLEVSSGRIVVAGCTDYFPDARAD